MRGRYDNHVLPPYFIISLGLPHEMSRLIAVFLADFHIKILQLLKIGKCLKDLAVNNDRLAVERNQVVYFWHNGHISSKQVAR